MFCVFVDVLDCLRVMVLVHSMYGTGAPFFKGIRLLSSHAAQAQMV